jgi:hypothetical protein
MTTDVESPRPSRRPRLRLALAGGALLVLGGAIGAGAVIATHPIEVMAPGGPVAIASLATATQPWVGEPVVTVRGQVAEVYGNRFVVADRSGRTLVEAGGPRDAGAIVTAGQIVTVQGRYEDGVIRARYLVGPDGRVAALRAPGGHRRGHGGRGRDDRGPDAPEAPPQPEPPAEGPAR